MSSTPPTIWTVGHSNHPLERFLALLRKQGIEAIADVRSSPYSRFAPQFNREALAASLRGVGIRYVFLGQELGARSKDPSCYANGRVVYARLAATLEFREGIERLLRGANQYKIAIMCAERDPLDCHRTILVAHQIAAAGAVVRHLLADGSVEPHDVAMTRLLGLLGLSRRDLFRSPDEILAEGLARQEARIAYVEDDRVADGGRPSP